MDFLTSLNLALRGHGNGEHSREASLIAIKQCNDDIEAFFGSQRLLEAIDDSSTSTLNDVAACLQSALLTSISSEGTRIFPSTDEDADILASEVTSNLTETNLLAELENENHLTELAELLRSCKNLLRWYMQIFLTLRGPILPSPLRRLENHAMIELYWTVVQETTGEGRPTIRQDVARNACLALFYATYSPAGNDERVQSAQLYLVEALGFLDMVMPILLEPNTPAVLLSLVRLVHNLLVSLPGSIARVEESYIQCIESLAPWAENGEDMDLRGILINLLVWSLQSFPTFPGGPEDRRADLVVEILRVFYVLRVGKNLTPSEKDSSLSQLISYFLMLPNSESRAYQCKLTAVTLLMDAPATFSEYLVEAKGIMPLLNVLDLQVTQIVERSGSGNQAAAALVPILLILNTFSAHSNIFREKVKKHFFPPEAEAHFQTLAAEETARSHGQGIGAKNMHPLDAPRDTLRWKLIRLMTWTESHTKRATSELLWTICDHDAKEFVLRTGFGNAMPMLSLKGLVQLPPELSS